jgi:NTP pyrophosphatase (non-canonical NTP hydrolase)
MEECGELIQAISKCYRDEITGSYKDRNTHLFNLTEECADVILNIFRLCTLYGVDEEFLMKVLAVKVERYRNYVKECTIKNKI